MNRIHIIGRKNHGKTTLICELVDSLSKRGRRVGTIKHTHHHHELDAPGKDSHRHQKSGAAVSGICSPSMNAVFWPQCRDSAEDPHEGDHKYREFAPMFEACDLVLVEGDTLAKATKIEVWRRDVGTASLTEIDSTIQAVITDDQLSPISGVPTWRRSDIESIADKLQCLLA